MLELYVSILVYMRDWGMCLLGEFVGSMGGDKPWLESKAREASTCSSASRTRHLQSKLVAPQRKRIRTYTHTCGRDCNLSPVQCSLIQFSLIARFDHVTPSLRKEPLVPAFAILLSNEALEHELLLFRDGGVIRAIER